MSGKATAVAPSNIAFIKYWGTRDTERTLPYDPSISMTLSRCTTRTTVEHLPDSAAAAEVLAARPDGDPVTAGEAFAEPVRRHLARLRDWAGASGSFRVATRNSFPAGAGLASSASGFAALTLAAAAALGRDEPPERLSVLARLSGSGSAARSMLGGYVEWPAGGQGSEGGAASLAAAGEWDLRDVIVVVDDGPKEVSSREGHRRAPTSPYFEPRRLLLPERLERVRRAIARRRFDELGPVVEEEAVDLHLIAMSSRPPIYYWQPVTLRVLAEVRRLRAEGVPVWATMDAGANVHLICPPEPEPRVAAAMEELDGVLAVIRDGVGPGPRLSEDHLL